MAETPEQKYNRIAAAVQQTILTSFPNPNRVGCPGDACVREVAARRTIVEDDKWQHITHCSACYAEFLAAKEQIRQKGRRERTLSLIGGAVLVILLAGVTGYRYLGEHGSSARIVALAFEPATLNLRDSSSTRGDGKAIQGKIPELPRHPLDLTIILPFGTEAGVYEFEFVDSAARILKRGDGAATIRNGDTLLKTRFNATEFPTGVYKLGIRQSAFDWVFFSVRLH